jgi:nicotinamide-nucleotide amidase
MFVEIITIGDELLIGQVVNTNASWMAEQLSMAGISVRQISAIADNSGEIMATLTSAENRADVMLITGGLGPTKDDITKKTLCDFFKRELVFDKGVYDHIENLFKNRGIAINDLNTNQAMIPSDCKVIQNNHGTAPGMWFEQNGKIFIAMPGVPFEMKAMMTDFIIPELSNRFHSKKIFYKTIHTQGIPESILAGKIEKWESGLPTGFKLAYLPQPGMVRLRLTTSGENETLARQHIEIEINKLKEILPNEIFGYDKDTLEKEIGIILNKKNQTLSTAESCTGGYIAHLITSVPGSSNYFKGSVVAYANEMKENILHVSHHNILHYGAVSEVVVKEMAEGARKLFNTDYAISTTGIAGPDGGTPLKPVGTTWIAIATASRCVAFKFNMGDHRERNIRRAALTALNLLRKELIQGF